MERRNLIEIDGKRLWSTVLRSSEIGPGKRGGMRRLALSDSDKVMRDQFVAWAKEAGCAVTVDQVGTIFARRKGREDLPPVVIGSHLDTQIAGGRYDGVLGVLAGLEVIRTLNDRGIETRRPIEVASWTNEEGARFTPAMTASGAFAGLYTVDYVHGLKDDDGVTFGQELKRIGYLGDTQVGGKPLDSYFELHIEQGPILDHERMPVGIVTKGYASHGRLVELFGENAHVGSTPMDQRRNALYGASLMVAAAHEIGWSRHASEGKGNASRLVCTPNKFGIIPDFAQVALDVRHKDPREAEAMAAELDRAIAGAAKKANVEMKVVAAWSFGNERFDRELVGLLKDAASGLGVPAREMMSQIGHDAYYVSRVAPTALIFTPCKDGISHNESEHTTLEDSVPGVNVLLNAVLARADR
ncbi:MAG: Zn-dependent hydrolase [Alphaproteobacteria bacterium]